jgi:hypothetical protein
VHAVGLGSESGHWGFSSRIRITARDTVGHICFYATMVVVTVSDFQYSPVT